MDRHKDMLNFLLSDVHISQKSKLIKNVKDSQAKILCEIAVNILYGVLQMEEIISTLSIICNIFRNIPVHYEIYNPVWN